MITSLMRASLVLGFAAAPHMAYAQAMKVEDIRVQLFYEHSGTFSEDLTKVKELSLRNTPIGEGAVKEPANAFLVSIVISGQASSFDKTEDVIVTISEKTTKRKPMVVKFGKLLFGEEGRMVKPIFVENKVCLPLRISARTKAGEKVVELPFHCGE